MVGNMLLMSNSNRKKGRVERPTVGVGVDDDFYAYMPSHQYIFAPSGEMWPASSVNAWVDPLPLIGTDGEPAIGDDGKRKLIAAASWLDREKPVEQLTWAPGEPELIRDRLISAGGWIYRPGCSCFNLYRPALVEAGDAASAGPWLDHVHRIYPTEATHIIHWLAHRIQRPHEKINHAIVLGGGQGIGKDSLLEPIKYGVGPWNFAEVSPQHLLGRFNAFVKSVILRVSEARDLGDVDRFTFYGHMKTYTASPPDVLRVDEKHLREYSVFNVCGVIITSNHKTDGIYLPGDDRRHFVAWSDASKEDFDEGFWSGLYGWYQRGGRANVVAYLRELDLAGFDPKAPPPKTAGFWAIDFTYLTDRRALRRRQGHWAFWPSDLSLGSFVAQDVPMKPPDPSARVQFVRWSREIRRRDENYDDTQDVDWPPFPQAARGLTCGATTRAGTPCRRRDLQGNGRCKLHGGLSTGPRTEEGRERAIANLKVRWRQGTP